MEYLKLIYPDGIVGGTLILLLFFFYAMLGVLILRRIGITLSDKFNTKRYELLKPLLISYISGEEKLDLLEKNSNNQVLRNQLIKMVTLLSGEEKKRLCILYDHFGFTKEDYKFLYYGSTLQRTVALSRLRLLQVHLSDADWLFLITNKNSIFRWAAMEYLIQQKKKSSLFWIAGFLTDHTNYHNGILQHLLCTLAQFDSETILILLKYTDDKRVAEQCLKTLSVYPTPSGETEIIRHMSNEISDEGYISAVRALSGAITPKVLEVFSLLLTYHHWVVRLIIAQSLGQIDDPTAPKMLMKLTEDMNYYVRRNAVISLLKLGSSVRPFLKFIFDDKEHPSHELLTYLSLHQGDSK